MRIRVMTYNLLYGFHERVGVEHIFREERARAAAAVVAAETPDLVAFTEGAFCGSRGRIVRHDFVALTGLPHVVAVGHEGEWCNVLASRFPIASVELLPLGTSPNGPPPSALRAVVDCGGDTLHVDVVHPSPHVTEAERVDAFAPLLASRPAARYVLLGDFNALSDEDDYDAGELAAQLRGNVPDPDALAARMLDRALVATVRAHGLIDTMPRDRRMHTIPTHLARPHATQGARIRIDYIFVSPDLRVVDAEIVQRAPADAVSDHYPIVATLEL